MDKNFQYLCHLSVWLAQKPCRPNLLLCISFQNSLAVLVHLKKLVFQFFWNVVPQENLKINEIKSRRNTKGPKEGNICFLSPLVLSKWEDLAFSVSRLFEKSVFIPASPCAANGRRPLAAPASVASVGAALCLKIHFFFRANSWIAILRQHKILSGTWQFLSQIGHKKLPSLNWF